MQPERPVEPMDVGEVGEPALVEGVTGMWWVDPSLLGRPFTGRTALLSPFDRLIHDRKRTIELFELEYQREIYKPATMRRWGYFGLPILHGDKLVGKRDAHADRTSGVLRIDVVRQDIEFTPTITDEVDREIQNLGQWLKLHLARSDWPGVVRCHRRCRRRCRVPPVARRRAIHRRTRRTVRVASRG